MKAAIYCRISTDKQSSASQLAELHEYCQRRGWDNVEEFKDTISGAKFTRQGLDRLMKEVRRGRVDAIVCYKLDRLGRSLAHLAQLLGELTSNKVALICPSQGIDTSDSNPASQFQLNILMAVAEFERELIKERVNAGIAAAKANGVRFGRPEKLSQRYDEVFQCFIHGKGIRSTARKLGMPISSVAKLFRKIRSE